MNMVDEGPVVEPCVFQLEMAWLVARLSNSLRMF